MAGELYYNISVDLSEGTYDLSQDISSLTISEKSGKPDQLTLELSDQHKAFSHALQIGLGIKVDIGTVDDHSLIFKGNIYKVEGEFPRDGIPSLRILAHDRSMAMGLRKNNKPWGDRTLKQIVTEIGKKYFGKTRVSVKVEGNPTFSGNGIRQIEETDLAFLLRLGQTYACELFVEVDEFGIEILHFKSQKAIMTSAPIMSVYHGRCGVKNRLLSFSANSDAGSIQLPRQLIGMDYDEGTATEMVTGKAEQVGETGDPFRDENLAALSRDDPEQATRLTVLFNAAGSAPDKVRQALGDARREAILTLTTQEDLQERAKNQFSTLNHGMHGSGTTHGNQHLHAQASIHIADVGGQFSGIWYLSQVRHSLNREGYQTKFECQR